MAQASAAFLGASSSAADEEAGRQLGRSVCERLTEELRAHDAGASADVAEASLLLTKFAGVCLCLCLCLWSADIEMIPKMRDIFAIQDEDVMQVLCCELTFDVCSRMLPYAHVCSRMLMYADVC
jgi:hypothetical protein